MPGDSPNTRATERPEPVGSENVTSPADDTLSALADVQAKIEHLKRFSSTQTSLQAKLQSERAAVEAREREISDRLKKVQESEERAERKLRELEEDRAAVDRRRDELENRRSELKRVKADLERRSREIDEVRDRRLKELEALRDEIEQKSADVESREKALAQRAHEAEIARRDAQAGEEKLKSERQALEEQTQQLRALAESLAKDQESLRQQQRAAAAAAEETQRTLDARIRDAEARNRESEAKAADVERSLESLAARQADLEQMKQAGEASLAQARIDAQAIEAQKTELAALAEEAARLKQEAEKQLRQANTERTAIAEERRTLEELGAELGRREQSLGSATASLDRTAAELLARAEKAEGAARDASSRLADAEARAQQSAAALTAASQEAQTLRAELENLRTERGELVRRLEILEKAGNAEASDAAANVAKLETEVARLTAEVAEKDRALASGGGSDAAELESVIVQLKDRLKSEAAQRKAAQETVAKLEAAVAEAHRSSRVNIVDLESQLDDARRAAAAAGEREKAAEQAREQAEELRRRAEDARKRAEAVAKEAASAVGGPPPKPFRAERLEKARTLRTAKVAKIRRAEAVVAKRYEICEQVISQRAQLAATHQIVMEAQKRVQKTKAKGKVAAILFYATASLGVLAALSWALAGQITPGRYVATSVLAAEARSGQLTAEQLEGWQQYHEKLITDPQFLEGAAEHMARKGITDLASPGVLKERVSKDLSWDAPAPGELHIELRGEGGERTARELSTFVTKLAWDAMAAREKRADGALTIIRQEAKAGETPINNERVMAAGMYLGGSVSFGLFMSLLLWKRLSNAKQEFERDEQIEAILDQARWPFPESAGKVEL